MCHAYWYRVILFIYVLCFFPPNTLISVALWRNIIRGGLWFIIFIKYKKKKYTEKHQGQGGLKLLGLC